MSTTEYITQRTCRACNSGNLELLVDYGMMPLAGGFMMPGEVASHNKTYPLRLARCPDCTLLQILDSVRPERIFSRYSYASSTTRTVISHFNEMGRDLVNSFSAQGKLVVEFGCNDGVLMRPLIGAGALAVGIDPSDVALRASREQGWPLFQEYFTDAVAGRILGEYGRARIVVGNNVFAHADDIHAMLRGVDVLLEDDGVFVIEVHYQGDLIESIQFDNVYHEHVCYFSLTSLVKLLLQYDLKVIEVKRIPVQAGSIRVTAARTASSYPVSEGVFGMLEYEKTLDATGFVREVNARRDGLAGLIEGLNRVGHRVVAYGASGRMTILLNYCGLGAEMIEYVVDMSPLRQGRIVPGILIPIVPPEMFHEAPPDYALMTAWNFEAEIVAREREFLRQGGRFIIPLPEIRIVDRG